MKRMILEWMRKKVKGRVELECEGKDKECGEWEGRERCGMDAEKAEHGGEKGKKVT